MDFDASLYDETNNLQYKTGEELINKIKEENYDKYVNLLIILRLLLIRLLMIFKIQI
jgi:hypothetical protein